MHPTSHNYPLVTGPVHSISHLNFPGSIQPSCNFRRTKLLNAQAFTVLPGTHLLLAQESASVGKEPCLGAQRQSIIQASRGSSPRSLARARYH